MPNELETSLAPEITAATDLAEILHRSMDWDRWGRKQLTYWGMFEEQLRSAAMTNTLGKCVNAVCLKMGVRAPGKNEWARKRLETILTGGNDKAVLRVLRDQTPLVVVLLRNRQQDRKEQFQQDIGIMEGEDYGTAKEL